MKKFFKAKVPITNEERLMKNIEEFNFLAAVPEWNTFKIYLYSHKNTPINVQIKVAHKLLGKAFLDERIGFNDYIDHLSNFSAKLYNLNIFEC